MEGTGPNGDDIFKGTRCFNPDDIVIGLEAEVAVAEEVLDILGSIQVLGSS